MVGSWTINISLDKMPQKVASAVGNINLIGAEYEFIAYIGSQVVNGVNHAVLAKQILTTGRDTENIVMLIFNEKDNAITLTNIERIAEGGGEFGGIDINIQTDIPDEAIAALNSASSTLVGATIKPYVLLGTKVTKGTNYIFFGTSSPVVPNATENPVIAVVNGLENTIKYYPMFVRESASLGYAFPW